MRASGNLKHYCVQRQLNLAFDAFIYDAINNLIYAFSKDFDLFFSVTRFNFQVCLKTLFKENTVRKLSSMGIVGSQSLIGLEK